MREPEQIARAAIDDLLRATGTDIKPLEIVMFMRAVKSGTFFEQMKGRGVRVINPADLQSVTPDVKAKNHFVIVDCVGVRERDMTETHPSNRDIGARLRAHVAANSDHHLRNDRILLLPCSPTIQTAHVT